MTKISLKNNRKEELISEIPLTNGKVAIVDAEDFDYLNQWKWCCNHGYAIRNGKRVNGKRIMMIRMHRLINQTPKGLDTDHINRNKLDH